MTGEIPRGRRWSARTTRASRLNSPLRAFLHTETGSARVLLAAAVVALAWVNLDESSYESLWGAVFSVRLGSWQVSHDLRFWVNSGLMTLLLPGNRPGGASRLRSGGTAGTA